MFINKQEIIEGVKQKKSFIKTYRDKIPGKERLCISPNAQKKKSWKSIFLLVQ